MSKFIELTSTYTDDKVTINMDEISSFYKDSVRLANTSFPRLCVKIFMKDGHSHTVSEPYWAIYKMVCNGNESDN